MVRKPLLILSALAAASTAAFAQTSPPDGMVLVPAGPFTMGTDSADRQGDNVPLGSDDARPQHTETTAAFFIDKLEVTNGDWKKFCQATNYPVPPNWKNGIYPAGQDNFAVNHVSWYEAKAYAAWVGKRLPTEIEWEKAARGTDARKYPWGEGWNPGRVVWNVDYPQAVGQHPDGASPYGALDMAGNVAEWTSSWFLDYPNAPKKLPSYRDAYKVVRGGGFFGYESICQTWYREVAKPEARSEWIGFRCAKDAP